MINHDFNTVKVSDGTEIELYVAMPEGAGPFPAIIVLQEAFGVNDHIRDITERFCAEGYAVVSPDLFHRTAHRIEVAYTDFATLALPHYLALTVEGLTADLEACYDWLAFQKNVMQEHIGSVGYCLGGKVSFLANSVLPLSAAVSYYGGGVEQLADRAGSLSGAHLFFWGGKDEHVTKEHAESITAAVAAAGKDYTSVTISYADHGFNCEVRPSYHPLAAKEAWAHTLAFLENRLK